MLGCFSRKVWGENFGIRGGVVFFCPFSSPFPLSPPASWTGPGCEVGGSFCCCLVPWQDLVVERCRAAMFALSSSLSLSLGPGRSPPSSPFPPPSPSCLFFFSAHACIRVCVCARARTRARVCVRSCVRACARVCAFMRAWVCALVCACVCACVLWCVRACVGACLVMLAFIANGAHVPAFVFVRVRACILPEPETSSDTFVQRRETNRTNHPYFLISSPFLCSCGPRLPAEPLKGSSSGSIDLIIYLSIDRSIYLSICYTNDGTHTLHAIDWFRTLYTWHLLSCASQSPRPSLRNNYSVTTPKALPNE